jgi:hypothetical protein
MSFKTFIYAALCILCVGVGVGIAGRLFLLFPLKVIAVSGAFFIAGMFFAYSFRAWRRSGKKAESKSPTPSKP